MLANVRPHQELKLNHFYEKFLFELAELSQINFHFLHLQQKAVLLYVSAGYCFLDNKVLQKLHYRIPEDVSLCCISGTALCTLVHPMLTAVEQPVVEIAHQACRLLLQQIQQPEMPKEQVVLRGEMVMRDSIRQKA